MLDWLIDRLGVRLHILRGERDVGAEWCARWERELDPPQDRPALAPVARADSDLEVGRDAAVALGFDPDDLHVGQLGSEDRLKPLELLSDDLKLELFDSLADGCPDGGDVGFEAPLEVALKECIGPAAGAGDGGCAEWGSRARTVTSPSG